MKDTYAVRYEDVSQRRSRRAKSSAPGRLKDDAKEADDARQAKVQRTASVTFDRLILEEDISKEDKALKYFFSALKDRSVDIFNNHYILFLPPKCSSTMSALECFGNPKAREQESNRICGLLMTKT